MRCVVVVLAVAAATAFIASTSAQERSPCCTCPEKDFDDDDEVNDDEGKTQNVEGNAGGSERSGNGGAGTRRVRAARAACESDETSVQLQDMALSALPECISPFAVQVNVSGNRLRHLPTSGQLSPLLVALDVSFNGINDTNGEELRALSALEALRIGGNPLGSLRFLPQPCALRLLHAQRCGLTSLQDALQCSLLETLDASGNRLTALTPGTLFVLGRLRRLNLSRNPLGALASRAFAGLGELQELRLADSGLSTLPQKVFDLPKLKILDLSKNEFSWLPPSVDVFARKSQITSLDLQGNKFTAIPWDGLEKLSSLAQLNIASNKIHELEGNKFGRYLPKLEKLSLQSNNLNSLPEDVFEGLLSLKHLDLSWNPLSAISSNVFSSLSALRSLSLSGCPLRILPFSTHVPMPPLTHLDAMKINLMTLPPGTLLALPNIQCLNLQMNPFKTFSSEAFVGAPRLRKLFLGGSKKSTLRKLVEDVFHDLNELRDLDLRSNKLEAIPNAVFQNNFKLKKINLSNNKLMKIPKAAFAHLNRLRELRLSGNRLSELPDLSACCGHLRYANFQNNSISWPGEEAFGALLRSDARRVSDLRGNPVRPQALVALAQKPGVVLQLDADSCACGSVRRGDASVRLCVEGTCTVGDDSAAATAWEIASVESLGTSENIAS